MKDSRGAGDKSNLRITALFWLFVLMGAGAAVRLVYLQVMQYPFYKEKAQKSQLSTVKQQVGRGTIYDRAGKKLAESIKSNSICICPRDISEKAKAAAVLSSALGLPKDAVLKKINSRSYFEYIKRKVDPEAADKILSYNIKGIFVQAEEKRSYPLSDAAAHVIGFSGMDNTGLEGLELSYEKYLRGRTGRVQIRRDAFRRPIMMDAVDIKKAEKGADIYLTLDTNVQYAAKAELDAAVKKFNAKAGTIITMNPENGAIYALVNYPSYDPNDPGACGSEAKRNRAVTDMYEPGSTFKIFAMSAFLDEFPDAESQKVFCGNGAQEFFGRIVHDHEKYGWLTVPEVIKYSSNIGMVSLLLKVQQEKMYKKFVKFGIGARTGTDMPGEAAGMLANWRDWDNTTLTSIPYGQEVAMTPIQLMKAYAMIANGGYAVTPHVVEKIEKNGSVVYRADKGRGKRVLNEKDCKRLTEMLKLVTEPDGSGKKAAIAGYAVAGKTGTAQKHNVNGKGYAVGKYMASFIGFLPADEPELLTLVVIDEPRPVYYGSEVAAPAFKNVNSLAITALRVSPQESTVAEAGSGENAVIDAKMPDVSMMPFPEAKKMLDGSAIKFQRYGFGRTVIGQSPQPGVKVTGNVQAYVLLGDKLKDSAIRVYMPDVRGLSIRKALEVLGAMGIKVKCTGSGYAVTQDPKPGVAFPEKKECTISFEMKDAG